MSAWAPSPPHTPFYCEENVYKLLDGWAAAGLDLGECYAVFVSNPSRAVLFACQRLSDPCLWDYHVFAAARDADGTLRACDADSTLPWGGRLDGASCCVSLD